MAFRIWFTILSQLSKPFEIQQKCNAIKLNRKKVHDTFKKKEWQFNPQINDVLFASCWIRDLKDLREGTGSEEVKGYVSFSEGSMTFLGESREYYPPSRQMFLRCISHLTLVSKLSMESEHPLLSYTVHWSATTFKQITGCHVVADWCIIGRSKAMTPWQKIKAKFYLAFRMVQWTLFSKQARLKARRALADWCINRHDRESDRGPEWAELGHMWSTDRANTGSKNVQKSRCPPIFALVIWATTQPRQ